MDVFDNIPSVKSTHFNPSEILERIMQQRREEQFDPFRMALMKAQADQAQENAKLTPSRIANFQALARMNNMWASAYGDYLGIPTGTPQNSVPGVQSQTPSTNPGQSSNPPMSMINGLMQGDMNNISNMQPGQSVPVSSYGSVNGAPNSSPNAPNRNAALRAIVEAKLGLSPHYTNADGKVVKISPNGQMESYQVGQTPEEKARLDIESSRQKSTNAAEIGTGAQRQRIQNVSDLKEQNETKKAAHELNDYVYTIKSAIDLLEKNPNATGPIKGFIAKKTPFTTDEKLTDIHTLFGDLLANKVKNYSQRGGAVALRVAGGYKPDISRTPEANLGMLKSMLKKALYERDQLEKQYKTAGGEELPIQFDQSVKNLTGNSSAKSNMVTIVNSKTGERRKVSREEANSLMGGG